jgi:hypothetical protein
LGWTIKAFAAFVSIGPNRRLTVQANKDFLNPVQLWQDEKSQKPKPGTSGRAGGSIALLCPVLGHSGWCGVPAIQLKGFGSPAGNVYQTFDLVFGDFATGSTCSTFWLEPDAGNLSWFLRYKGRQLVIPAAVGGLSSGKRKQLVNPEIQQ